MMNHHMPAGPGQPHMSPVMPMHPPRGRPQEFHPYHHAQQPPMHPAQYQTYHHPPPYYTHPSPYQPQRWLPHYSPQHFVPPPQPQSPYQPRSPMVVTSQIHAPMTPVTRQTPVPPNTHSPHPMQSPRAIPHHVQQQQHQHQQQQHQQQQQQMHPQQPQQHYQQPQQQQQQPTPATTPSPAPPAVVQKAEERADSPPPPPTPTRRASAVINPLSLPPEHKEPYWPSLPWYSDPDSKTIFSRRNGHRLRKRGIVGVTSSVALPKREEPEEESTDLILSGVELVSDVSTIAAPSEIETPATSLVPSESEFTNVSSPGTPAPVAATSPTSVTTPHQHARKDTRTAIAVPNLPNLTRSKEGLPVSSAVPHGAEAQPGVESAPKTEDGQLDASAQRTPHTPPPKPAPKSWADLVKRNTNGAAAVAITPDGSSAVNGIQLPKSATLADALRQYSVQDDMILSFLEPRGLVNTGNMCYMNSILQVLLFCVPFYTFLDQVRLRTVHSMKSDTPLLDAMIMVMREFKVLTSADTSDALRATLKQDQLELYGDAVTPDYLYDVIRKLPRFAGMRDAEEFLGFLLEGMHDECVLVMQGQPEEHPAESGVASPTSVVSPNSADGWLEVGPKQKASVTRTAGQQDAPSPVTKIFGGHLRSELRVAGLKDSVTLEPYKPLQLDIGAQHVNNIVDALKGLTKTEVLTGDFGGRGNVAKKQVFIDTLPPVLILHLKRFQYDNNLTGTQKIWKKVGYPLELEIPKEVFTTSKRGGLAVKGGLPRYRLISVVYHHGKSAAGGHYTADVLRQDSREWIRIDDTIIRRIRPEDVAEGGAEEDPKILARALEQHRADQELQKQRNMYQGLDEDVEEEKPWSEVNGGVNGQAKKWSGVAAAAAPTNGTATPSSATGKHTPTMRKEGVRDNKVAYILLYERIRG